MTRLYHCIPMLRFVHYLPIIFKFVEINVDAYTVALFFGNSCNSKRNSQIKKRQMSMTIRKKYTTFYFRNIEKITAIPKIKDANIMWRIQLINRTRFWATCAPMNIRTACMRSLSSPENLNFEKSYL